jgi:hypothetical protein
MLLYVAQAQTVHCAVNCFRTEVKTQFPRREGRCFSQNLLILEAQEEFAEAPSYIDTVSEHKNLAGIATATF